MRRILFLALSMTTAACGGGDISGSSYGAAGGGGGGVPSTGGSFSAGGTTASGGTHSTGGIGPTGGTATGGRATGGAATGGTAGTTSTDATCFACLSQYCAADWADCGTPCQLQLATFRACAYERQYGLQADQNGVPETYGEYQQDSCLNVVDEGEINNLDPAVAPLIGCASDPNTGLACEATCFVFT